MTRENFIEAWQSKPRQVALEIALVTAQKESSFRELATRYESARHARAERNQEERASRTDWTSYGLFQVLGQNLDDLGYRSVYVAIEQGESVLQEQMAAYDVFMGRLLNRNDPRTAFRKYNGSGPMAESYADDAMRKLGSSLGIEITPKFDVKADEAGVNAAGLIGIFVGIVAVTLLVSKNKGT